MTVTFDLAEAARNLGFVAAAVAVLVVVMALFRFVRRFFASRKFAAQDRESLRRRWQEIEDMAGHSGEMQRKLAIVEADKLLDQALKTLAMPGETLGERLKFAEYRYPDLRGVWWAHKVRNQLVHEATFHLDSGVARSAIAAFRKALTRLGAI